MQFSVRGMFSLVLLIAVFLGLRSAFVFQHDDTIFRAWCAAWIMAAMFSAFAAVSHGWDVGAHPLIRNCAIAGGAGAGMTLIALGLEIYPWASPYIDRWMLLREILFYDVSRAILLGGFIGAIVGFVWGVASQDTKS